MRAMQVNAPVPLWARNGVVFLVDAARDDLQRVIRQRPLQRLRLIPWRAHPDVALLVVGQVTGMAFWVGSTTAFGVGVRKP
jgi:hypothetical protein